MTADFELIVNGKKISMNEFVSNIVHDIAVAILKNLHGAQLERISKLEIS
ncbi:MAG: hypothetical protein ACFFEF_04390 [Candidatus Thorarchaeota archaeon]